MLNGAGGCDTVTSRSGAALDADAAAAVAEAEAAAAAGGALHGGAPPGWQQVRAPHRRTARAAACRTA